jgi:hypothetical protein
MVRGLNFPGGIFNSCESVKSVSKRCPDFTAGTFPASRRPFLQTKFLQKFFHGQMVVSGHGLEHAFDKGAGFERFVFWNRDVMFAVQLG